MTTRRPTEVDGDRLLPIEGIKRGLEDLRSGRLIDHDEAMAELDAAIEAAARERLAPQSRVTKPTT